MIDDATLTALRCAAAVCSAIPRVRLRIEAAHRTLAQVANPPFPERHDGHLVPACRFRATVAQAHADARAGRDGRALAWLDECPDATVAFELPCGGEALAPGLLRVDHDRRWLHLVALPTVGPGLDDLVAEPIAVRDHWVDVACHPDTALGTTIVHVSTDVDDRDRSRAAADALVEVMARATVHEVEAHLWKAAAGLG